MKDILIWRAVSVLNPTDSAASACVLELLNQYDS